MQILQKNCSKVMSQMSDYLFFGGVAVVVVAVLTGVFFGANLQTPGSELDKICYSHDPDWSYKHGSALYWNQTLSFDCVGPVVTGTDAFGFNVTEKQVQATLELEEVNSR